jgi:hypothetical protein
MKKLRENNRISPVYREPTDQELRLMSFRDMTPDERERFARLYPKEDKRRWRIILADLRRTQKQLSEQWIRMPESNKLRIIKQEPKIRFEAEQKSDHRDRKNILRRKGIRNKYDLVRKLEKEKRE